MGKGVVVALHADRIDFDFSTPASRRVVRVPWPGAAASSIQLQLPFAPRCALAGERLLSVATKVAKNALYRRQLFEVPVGLVWGLGVRHQASIADLLVRAACSSSAYGRPGNFGFDDYRRGIVPIVLALFPGDAEVGSSVGM